MPTQHTITLYEFDELPNEKAKQKARDWWRESSMNDDWYESVYEDAKQAGLKITAFDTYRGDSCDIEFTDGAFNCANTIKAEHGKDCASYKAAIAYITAMDALPDTGSDDAEAESRNAQAGDELETEFLKALSRAYLQMLRDQLEDVQSDAYIDDCLTGNEYTFLVTGKRFEPPAAK